MGFGEASGVGALSVTVLPEHLGVHAVMDALVCAENSRVRCHGVRREMVRVKDKTADRRGTTVVELTVAVAIMATVFAAIMPLFAGIRNSADTQWANLEMVQDARVLNEQLSRDLAGARRVVAVSSSSSNDGYIEFEAADGGIYRCGLGANGRVECGPVGDPSELVGPVDSLRFVCYDGNDLSNSTQTPEAIRLVTWEAGLRSTGSLAHDKTVLGACYLRVAASAGSEEEGTETYDFTTGQPGVNCFAFADQGESQVPDEPGIPAQAIEGDQYNSLAADDQQSHVLAVSDESQYAQLRVTFQIEQDPRDLLGLIVTWSGSGVNADSSRTDGATVFLWNHDSSRYEQIQASPNTDLEITLAGSGSAVPNAYVGGAGDRTVTLLVVSNDKKTVQQPDTLFTNYVKVDVVVSPRSVAVVP